MRGLLARAASRSGELTFFETTDGATGEPPARFRQALALAGTLDGVSVVDVGCWTGEMLSLCAQGRAARLVGIDIGGPWLESARTRVPTAQLVPVRDLSELDDVAVPTADLILFLETLEHLPPRTERAALTSLARLMGPSSRLILSTPAAGLAALLDPAWPLLGHRHYRKRSLDSLLRGAGLEPIRYHYSGDALEATDVLLFYAAKHVLRRPYRTPAFLRRGLPELTASRSLDSTTIWVEARLRPEPTPGLKADVSQRSVELGATVAMTSTIARDSLARKTGLWMKRSSGTSCQIAVVVPTRNSARTLETCLESLRAQSIPCTIVVVDNGSTDGTTEIARKLADVLAFTGPERSAQRNAGARLAPAPYVGFIDSDMVVGADVVAEALRALESGSGGVIVPERSFGTGFWAAVRAFERSFYVGSDGVEAARFFRRETFDAVGGFDETLPPGPEDWDLTVRVRSVSPVTRIDSWIDHDEGAPTLIGLWRKKSYYAPGLKIYTKRYGLGAGAHLDRPYVRQPWLLWSEGPKLGAGLVALKVGEGLAVAWGARRPSPAGSGRSG